jgi:hypothetical protein
MRRIEKAPASAGAFFHVMRGGGIVCRDTNSAVVPRERNFDSAQSGCSAGAVLVVSMFEVVVEKRSQFRWEWRVCDRAGKALVCGWEETRNAAKYRGERALFQLLLVRVPRLQPPPG